jgi:hypothetical protein
VEDWEVSNFVEQGRFIDEADTRLHLQVEPSKVKSGHQSYLE